MNRIVRDSEEEVSVFKNYIYSKNSSLKNIITAIREGNIKNEITLLRQYKLGNNPEADHLKDGLPGFTPAGTFNISRKANTLIKYSQIIGLDFDHIIANEEIKKKYIGLINSQKCTLGSFISPSGDGVKVFVRIDSKVQHHEIAHQTVGNHYEMLLGEKADQSCKDITRLCYASYDPGAYFNEEAEVFEVIVATQETEQAISKIHNIEQVVFPDGCTQFEKLIELTGRKLIFTKGYRNKFVFLLSNNCNRWGMSVEDAIENIICSGYCYHEKKVIATINSAYKNVDQHNIFPLKSQLQEYPNFSSFQVCTFANKDEQLADDCQSNPFIPEFVYENLPSIIKDGTDAFKEKRQKDILLTGIIGVLSGCFPSISGEYKGDRLYSNLYTFITAPAGSGKGPLKYAKFYGNEFHKSLIQKSSKDNTKSKELLYMPGNASNAALMAHLQQNKGIGIFFESEADSLSNALKNDWANFSDLLRKGYHHESVSLTRKGNFEHIEIDEPKLSVVLSGTPKQVQSLTNSVEDGLFSRFTFYSFRSEPIWESVAPTKDRKESLTEYFKRIGKVSYEIIKKYADFESIKFDLTENQWKTLDEKMSGIMTDVTESAGDDTSGLVKRMGVMWFRIAMILTTVRCWETADEIEGLICSDLDFGTAQKMLDVYKVHILNVYESMPKTAQPKDPSMELLFNRLPNTEFKRKEAVDIGETINIPYSKVDRLLPRLVVEGKLSYKYNCYQKIV